MQLIQLTVLFKLIFAPPVAVTCIQLLVVTYKSWLPKLYFRAPQLRCECPKTLEQPTTATPRFNTDT